MIRIHLEQVTKVFEPLQFSMNGVYTKFENEETTEETKLFERFTHISLNHPQFLTISLDRRLLSYHRFSLKSDAIPKSL